MTDESRIGLYDYIYGLFFGVVSDNVYQMNEPQELTESDMKNGFIVIRVGNVYDESEFYLNTYGVARVYIEAYIPPMSRGRLDRTKFKTFEDAINNVINNEIHNGTSPIYSINDDGVLSMDDTLNTNADNEFYMLIKSFIVTIDGTTSSSSSN